MSIRDEAAEIFAEGHAEENLGDPFTYAGQTGFFGTFDAERTEIVFGDYGQREVVRRSVLALKTQWDEEPAANLRPEVVAFGISYVLAGEVGEDGVHYVLNLEKRT